MIDTCPNCGKARIPGKLFCKGCGKSFEDSPVAKSQKNPGDMQIESSKSIKNHLQEDIPESDGTANHLKGASSWFSTFLRVFMGAVLLLGGSLGSLFLVSLLVGERSASRMAREKVCYANMRVIMDAVEMYNMDHTDMIDNIDNSDIAATGFLVKEGYLKKPSAHPTSSCYYSGYDLTASGTIVCDSHGTVD